MTKVTISKQYSFDAAHQLIRHDWTDSENDLKFGKCFRKHGHTYTLTIEVTGQIDSSTGMVLNYHTLDDVVKPVIEKYLDHYDLNERFFGILTTAENLVTIIGEIIQTDLEEKHSLVDIVSVTLSETPKTTAKWIPDA